MKTIKQNVKTTLSSWVVHKWNKKTYPLNKMHAETRINGKTDATMWTACKQTPMRTKMSINTVECCYNVDNFLKNIHKRHPIARPLGRGMGCLFWIQHLIGILPEFLQSFMQYLTTLNCAIIYAISYYIELRYNCTQLYMELETTPYCLYNFHYEKNVILNAFFFIYCSHLMLICINKLDHHWFR